MRSLLLPLRSTYKTPDHCVPSLLFFWNGPGRVGITFTGGYRGAVHEGLHARDSYQDEAVDSDPRHLHNLSMHSVTPFTLILSM